MSCSALLNSTAKQRNEIRHLVTLTFINTIRSFQHSSVLNYICKKIRSNLLYIIEGLNIYTWGLVQILMDIRSADTVCTMNHFNRWRNTKTCHRQPTACSDFYSFAEVSLIINELELILYPEEKSCRLNKNSHSSWALKVKEIFP